MGEETRATIISNKGQEYFEKWINLSVGQWDKICLVVPYTMG